MANDDDRQKQGYASAVRLALSTSKTLVRPGVRLDELIVTRKGLEVLLRKLERRKAKLPDAAVVRRALAAHRKALKRRPIQTSAAVRGRLGMRAGEFAAAIRRVRLFDICRGRLDQNVGGAVHVTAALVRGIEEGTIVPHHLVNAAIHWMGKHIQLTKEDAGL